MRTPITRSSSRQLRYMIREIVETASQIAELGQEITWENIGDPVRKGESPPLWIKEIVGSLASGDTSYAYSHSQGNREVRTYLAAQANARLQGTRGPLLAPDDLVFFNGLGDAVATVFGSLGPTARVLGPSPAYSTHSSAEAAHADSAPLTYHLYPERGWLPDLQEVEDIVSGNPGIAGILIINPDNPTGVVYPPEVLAGFARVAKRYDLFLISDETYANIVYGPVKHLSAHRYIGHVPALVMRSISKEFPWPGARCGWIEVYNRGSDRDFAAFIDSIVAAKRLQVCSTTLPQLSIPLVQRDPRYPGHLQQRNSEYQRRAEEAVTLLRTVPQLDVQAPGGGFFITPSFRPGALPSDGRLPIASPQIRELVEKQADGAAPDARFVYYLLGATGICVVPLSGFSSDRAGFRMTLLEQDDSVRRTTLARIAAAVQTYCHSSATHAAS